MTTSVGCVYLLTRRCPKCFETLGVIYLLEKLPNRDSECVRQLDQSRYAQVFFAALYGPSERPGKPAVVSEFLL
jgi:hypothetical protein